MIAFTILLVCFGLLIGAALHDAATRTIPNVICSLLLVFTLAFRVTAGGVVEGICFGLVVFACMLLLWLRALVGGGDVKLITAASVAVPTSSLASFLLAVALAGGVLALTYLGLSLVVKRPAPGPRHGFFARILKAEAWRISRRGPLPYAAAIAAGGLIVLIPRFLLVP